MRRKRTLGGRSAAVAAVVTLVAILSATACSSPPAPGAPDDTTVFAQAITDAQAGGTSDSQIKILEDARDAGELTLEDVKEAVAGTFACFEDAGIGHSAADVITQEGLPRVSYSFSGIAGASDDAALAVADACMNTNSLFVEILYVSQPQSLEVTDQYFTDHGRGPLIECLRSLGVTIEDDASNDEVWQVAEDMAVEIGAPYANGEIPGVPTDCISTLVNIPSSWGE